MPELDRGNGRWRDRHLRVGSTLVALTASYPSSDTVWTVTAMRIGTPAGNTWTPQAYVICSDVS
jgi:hypothetical protein